MNEDLRPMCNITKYNVKQMVKWKEEENELQVRENEE